MPQSPFGAEQLAGKPRGGAGKLAGCCGQGQGMAVAQAV
jgi:hypothetical protein